MLLLMRGRYVYVNLLSSRLIVTVTIHRGEPTVTRILNGDDIVVK